jgi:hypothetical protein
MAQHDYSLANQSGSSFRGDINSVLSAIVSLNSGATAPNPTFAYMWWADTTSGLLKQRDSTNASWITKGTLASAGATGIPFTPTGGLSSTDVQAALEELDNYEEGTWTPSVEGDATYTGTGGQYIKIGRLVFVQGFLSIDVLGTGSINSISGLPFPFFGTGGISVPTFVGLATAVASLTAKLSGTTSVVLTGVVGGGGTTSEGVSNLMGNGTFIALSGCYLVAP